MEILEEVNYNDNNFQILVQKLQDNFKEFILDVKNDGELHKFDKKKEKKQQKGTQKNVERIIK